MPSVFTMIKLTFFSPDTFSPFKKKISIRYFFLCILPICKLSASHTTELTSLLLNTVSHSTDINRFLNKTERMQDIVSLQFV